MKSPETPPAKGPDAPPAAEAAAPAAPAPEVRAERERLEAEAKGLLDQLLRLKAEFENFRRRTDREKAELVRWGKAELLGRLLPLYDLLLTAHGHLQEYQGDAKSRSLADGMEMIFKEFSRLFESEGVRPIESAGQAYSPDRHEVLGAVETADAPEGAVVEELQRGYMLGDKVLRPAKVRIARPPAAPPGKEAK